MVVLTALAVGAVYLAYPFISLLADRRAGVGATGFPLLLVAHGVLGVLAVLFVSRWIDRSRGRISVAILGLLAISPLAVAFGSPAMVVLVLVLWGAPIASLPPMLHTDVIRLAGPAADVASSAYVVAFQVGIAGGSAIGAQVPQLYGLTSMLVVAAAVGFVALVFWAVSGRDGAGLATASRTLAS